MIRGMGAKQAIRGMVLAILLACFAYLGTQVSRLSLLSADTPNPQRERPQLRTTNTDIEPIALSEVQAEHLFDINKISSEMSIDRAEPAADEKLDLALLGVFRATDEEGGAIIQSGIGHVGLYGIGDVIDGRASLAMLGPSYVLIRRAGEIEKLTLKEWDAIAELRHNSDDLSGDNRDEKSNVEVDELSGSREQSMSKLGIAPVSVGAASGYKVVDEDGQLVEAFDFQAGDTIVSINGYPLGTEVADLLARRSLEGSGIANIVVRRKRAEFLLEYHVESKQVRGLDALKASGKDGASLKKRL